MMHNITVFEEDPESPDALDLTRELSETLERKTGRSGRASFNSADVRAPRACSPSRAIKPATPQDVGLYARSAVILLN